jgi:hypothetical protein
LGLRNKKRENRSRKRVAIAKTKRMVLEIFCANVRDIYSETKKD